MPKKETAWGNENQKKIALRDVTAICNPNWTPTSYQANLILIRNTNDTQDASTNPWLELILRNSLQRNCTDDIGEKENEAYHILQMKPKKKFNFQTCFLSLSYGWIEIYRPKKRIESNIEWASDEWMIDDEFNRIIHANA